MSSIEFDTSELYALAKDLLDAAQVRDFEKVMHKAANNIKRVMKADAIGHRHLPGLPSRVNYDFDTAAGGRYVSVIVGFDKKKQGNLANIAAFGSRNNAPVMDITRGLREELPRLERWLSDFTSGVLK
jgi:hypothetical protein